MGVKFQFIAETIDSRRAFGPWSNTPTECLEYYEQKAPPPKIDSLELKKMRLRK